MNYVIIILISSAMGFAGAWKLQEISYKNDISVIKKEHQEELQKIKDVATEQLDEMVKNHAYALQNAVKRHAQLSRDVLGTRDALVRLSTASEEAIRTSRASTSACHAAVDTFRIVFDDCGKRYEQVGRDAQGHVIDKQSLIESLSSKEGN